MAAESRRLVLFDIDGTLVHTGGAGKRGMNAAFERLHRRAGALDGVPLAGRTDRAIVTEVFAAMGRAEPADEEVFRLRDEYLDALRLEMHAPPGGDFGVLPGVEPLLDALAALPGVTVALLTGNFEGGADIKLGHFGLRARFAFGAFGDRHVDRRDLVPIAVERAVEAGYARARPDHVVVIGDTPLDVDCARAYGARAVGVATGPFGVAALSRAGASLAIETLEDVERVVSFVAGTGGSPSRVA